MIPEGTEAPGFELPGWVDGERRRVALDEFVGDDVVILAFYPADFNPACDVESDLDELDLFTMQKDVSVLAVGPDTLYSHAAFADEYDLQIPLLSDTRREVAETYGVTFEDDVGQRLIERAVVVVDHDGVIQYAWSTPEMAELPPIDEVKDAISDTGGDDTAFARYRVGHAHYTEGRRAFTSAMHSYRDSEWMMAQSDFKRAREEFEEAADHFDSAVRFVDDEEFETYYDRTQEKATALWQAADWLSNSASEYSSGRGAKGQRLRDDAESPLENARDIGEPVDPDDWPPDPDEDAGRESILPEEHARDTALAVDVDDEVAAEEARAEAADAGAPAADDEADESDIDDAELEEIEAELAASQPDNPEGEEPEENPTSMVDAPPDRADEDDQAEDGAIDGDVGEDDLKALEAEMAASESAAREATRQRREAAAAADGSDAAANGGLPDEVADASDDSPAGDSSDGDLAGVGPASGDLAGDDPAAESSDERDDDPDDAFGTDDGPGQPAADPHADLASGSGGTAGTSGSLEPQDGKGNADEDEPELAEPQGASDDDLADIPTAEDLADEEESDGDEERSAADGT